MLRLSCSEAQQWLWSTSLTRVLVLVFLVKVSRPYFSTRLQGARKKFGSGNKAKQMVAVARFK